VGWQYCNNNVFFYSKNSIYFILSTYVYFVGIHEGHFLKIFPFLTDASSSNEAVHLQQRLKSLSTELVTLRNRLHVGQAPGQGQNQTQNQGNGSPGNSGPKANNFDLNVSSPNLNLSSSGAHLSASAVQQHTNGHHTATKVG